MYGPRAIDWAHTVDEYVPIDDLVAVRAGHRDRGLAAVPLKRRAVLRGPGRGGRDHATSSSTRRAPGEVEVRIAAAGVCGSDLHVVRGRLGGADAGRARARGRRRRVAGSARA